MPDIKEYIERRALLENLERFAPEHLTQLLRDLISKQPAADVVEVVHAELDENGRCKNCGKQANVQSIGFGHCVGTHRINYEHTMFCSACGARMDGERIT